MVRALLAKMALAWSCSVLRAGVLYLRSSTIVGLRTVGFDYVVVSTRLELGNAKLASCLDMSRMQVNAQCQVYSILSNRNRASGAPAHRKALKSNKPCILNS